MSEGKYDRSTNWNHKELHILMTILVLLRSKYTKNLEINTVVPHRNSTKLIFISSNVWFVAVSAIFSKIYNPEPSRIIDGISIAEDIMNTTVLR